MVKRSEKRVNEMQEVTPHSMQMGNMNKEDYKPKQANFFRMKDNTEKDNTKSQKEFQPYKEEFIPEPALIVDNS